MSGNFGKIKKKYLLAAIIKGVAVGVSFCLAAVGALLLANKVADAGIHWAVFIPVALCAFAAAGAVTFVLLRPTDYALAKKLDVQYALGEKAQTMVVYRDSDDDMAVLQREDTHERLGAIAVNTAGLRHIWQYLLIAVICLALFLTSVIVPAAASEGGDEGGGDEPGIVDEVFEYDTFRRQALKELIRDVEKSSLGENIKLSYVATLSNLDSRLESVEWVSAMKAEVLAAIERINTVTERFATYKPIAASVKEYDLDLATALTESAIAYQRDEVTLGELYEVDEESLALSDKIAETVTDGLGKSKEKLKVGQANGLMAKLSSYAQNTDGALTDSGVQNTDEIYEAFSRLSEELKKIAASNGLGDSVLWRNIDGAFNDFGNRITVTLRVQSYDSMMNVFVRTRLADIFGLDEEELPDTFDYVPPVKNDDSSGDDEEDPGNHGGGVGGGDKLFGSDEAVYDPDSGEKVKYGEVIDDYYARMYEKLFDDDVPDEVKERIKAYFDMLMSGIKEEE